MYIYIYTFDAKSISTSVIIINDLVDHFDILHIITTKTSCSIQLPVSESNFT